MMHQAYVYESREHERNRHIDEIPRVIIKEETLEEEVTSTSSFDGPIIQHVAAVSIIQHVNHTANITDHRGRYGFRMEYPAEDKLPSKSCNYTYSSSLNKLFIQKMKTVPLKFMWEVSIPANEVEIRSYLVFKETFIRGSIVGRCLHHLAEDYNLAIAHHVMECVDEGSTHTICPGTQRHITILTPYNLGNCDIYQFTGNLRFRCTSMCRGGIDRRSTLAIFDLYVKNKYEGRSVLEVSICSSPGRGRLNNENKLILGKRNADMPSNQIPTGGSLREEPKRVRDESSKEDDDRYYYIKVKGLENAIILQKIAAALNAQVS